MLNPRHRRSPKNLNLNDVYDDWLTGRGVLSSLTTAPWHGSVSDTGLDLAYHGSHSGGKFVTSLLYNFIDDDGHITNSGFSAVATVLMAKYGAKWTHLWQLYATQYNPLYAYNMSETEISEDTGTETTEIDGEIRRARNQTLTESGSHDSTATRTPNLSEATSSRDVTDATVETTRTPNLSEATTSRDVTDATVETTRTPNLSEATTSRDVTDATVETTRTPNLREVTVLDENIQSTGDETDETTYGHVVTTDDDQTKAATLSVFGFNSSTAVPKETTSGTDTDDNTVTHSGTDVTTKETDSGTERDSTTTKTTTGTDTVTEDTDSTVTGTNTKLTTGTDTTTEDTDSTVTGSNTKLTTGTDTTTEDTDSTVTGSNTKLTTGTDSTRDTGTTTGTKQNADSETTGEDRTSELTVDRRNEVTRTRQGNMFKAPGELLSIDRDFWLTEFFDIVFTDIDQLLTLSIYAESPVRYKIY